VSVRPPFQERFSAALPEPTSVLSNASVTAGPFLRNRSIKMNLAQLRNPTVRREREARNPYLLHSVRPLRCSPPLAEGVRFLINAY